MERISESKMRKAAARLEYKNLSIIATVFLSIVFFIAPRIVFAQVLINEIMYDLSGADDKHEWVEIYNNGSSPVDLSDWKFNDGDTATNHGLNAPPKNNSRGSTVLDAGDYALLADDAATLIADLPNYNGIIIDTVLALSNTDATLKLFDQDGLEIAAIAYNKNLGGAGNGRSLEWDGAALKESAVDGGTPGEANSVLTSSGATPSAAPSASPAAANSSNNNSVPATPSPAIAPASPNYQYSQDVLLNEFLPSPNNGEKEWVELFNAGSSAINLSGWQIDDEDNATAPQIIPTDTIISPNGFLVISFNKNTLNNDGDKVRLLWPDDQVVHAVAYSKASPGQSVAKFGDIWLWTNQPTPGRANKKSLTAKNEILTLAGAPNSGDKITAIEEAAAIDANTPPSFASADYNTKTATITPGISADKNEAVKEKSALNPNLIAAAASQPLQESSGLKTIFTLATVIILSSLAAGGLLYFRRQKSVDSQNFDD